MKKLGFNIEERIVASGESARYAKGDSDVVEEKVAQHNKINKQSKTINETRDLTLNADIIEKIRKKNK